jgi:hypothetical protein
MLGANGQPATLKRGALLSQRNEEFVVVFDTPFSMTEWRHTGLLASWQRVHLLLYKAGLLKPACVIYVLFSELCLRLTGVGTEGTLLRNRNV